MPPKTAKKKKAKKGPEYKTSEADLQPYGVKAGQLVRNALGCTATVLGVGAAAAGQTPQLWVHYPCGRTAPVEAAGLQPCSAAEQLQADIEQRRREQQKLDTAWQVYNAEQERKAEAARKAAARKKKKPPAEAQAAGPAPAEAPPASGRSAEAAL